jgi:hypothetical protein
MRRRRDWFPSRRGFVVMDRASHFREQADHARRLAEATWQETHVERRRPGDGVQFYLERATVHRSSAW